MGDALSVPLYSLLIVLYCIVSYFKTESGRLFRTDPSIPLPGDSGRVFSLFSYYFRFFSANCVAQLTTLPMQIFLATTIFPHAPFDPLCLTNSLVLSHRVFQLTHTWLNPREGNEVDLVF